MAAFHHLQDTLASVVRVYSRSLGTSSRSSAMQTQKLVKSSKPAYTPFALRNRVVKLVDAAGDVPKLAVANFNAAMRLVEDSPTNVATVEVYNELIGIALKQGRHQRAWFLIQKMKKRGLRPTERTYATYFAAIAQTKHTLPALALEQVKLLFQEYIKTYNRSAPTAVLTTYVSVLLKQHQIEEALNLINTYGIELFDHPQSCLTVLFRAIRAKPNAKLVSAARQVFDNFVGHDYEYINRLDPMLCGAYFGVLAKGDASDYETAFSLGDFLLSHKSKLVTTDTITLTTYLLLILAHNNAQHWQKAQTAMEASLKRAKLDKSDFIDQRLVDIYLDILARNGQADLIIGVLAQLLRQRLTLTDSVKQFLETQTIEIADNAGVRLIEAYRQSGDYSNAESAFSNLQNALGQEASTQSRLANFLASPKTTTRMLSVLGQTASKTTEQTHLQRYLATVANSLSEPNRHLMQDSDAAVRSSQMADYSDLRDTVRKVLAAVSDPKIAAKYESLLAQMQNRLYAYHKRHVREGSAVHERVNFPRQQPKRKHDRLANRKRDLVL